MPVIHKEALINAPAANIFQIIENPNALTQYAPGITEVADIHQSAGRIGDNFKATYSLIGLKFPTKYTTVEYTNPSKLVVQLDGQMVGTFGWTLMPQGNATKVNVDIDYKVKGGLFGKMMNSLMLERTNEKNAEEMLANLRQMTEPK